MQRIIIQKARKQSVGVFVATNLLESMVDRRRPTRAEAHDVVDTVLDGAAGLTLAAETAIGKYPIECVNMLDRLIRHAEDVARIDARPNIPQRLAASWLERSDYLVGAAESSGLTPPHGGRLITRVISRPDEEWLQSLPRVRVSDDHRLEVEQIAIGTYSPLEGFMGERDFLSVLNEMRLSDGTPWPIPIVLDASPRTAGKLAVGQDVALVSVEGEPFAVLHLEEKFSLSRRHAMLRLYGTTDPTHPGARSVPRMKSIALGGKIDLIHRRQSPTREYELSPRQVRHLFDEKGWLTVLGFHTSNPVPQRDELLRLEPMSNQACDGFFIHPVIGSAEPGDSSEEQVVNRWEATARRYLSSANLVFAVWPSLPRYAGPRGLLFAALCRKNFGCSHFTIGTDRVQESMSAYSPETVRSVFDQFDDLGITFLQHEAASEAKLDMAPPGGTDASVASRKVRKVPA